jgi:hypothetical protein
MQIASPILIAVSICAARWGGGLGEAASVAGLLRPGSRIAVRGPVLQTKHGHVVAADEIGPDRHSLKPARGTKDKGKKKNEPIQAGASNAIAEQG